MTLQLHVVGAQMNSRNITQIKSKLLPALAKLIYYYLRIYYVNFYI
jgi:hypothetical protein